MTAPRYPIGAWVWTPDGRGQVSDYTEGAARPYSVALDRVGVDPTDASADNVRTYAAAELRPAEPPRWAWVRSGG